MRLLGAISVAAALVLSAGIVRAETPVKDGDTVAFLGDSITQFGARDAVGYVKLVESGFRENGINIKVVGAGISGNKSNDMLTRLERDVISKKPTWMTLSCGVNDVWHGERGVPLEKYKENIAAIVDKAQAAGIKVVILTSTMIYEDAGNDNNKKLAAYNDYLRELAKAKDCRLADLSADMISGVAAAKQAGTTGLIMTVDGVHMNPVGNMMMAKGILKAFGLTDAQLAKAQDKWLDTPGAYPFPAPKGGLSIRQYQALNAYTLKEYKKDIGAVLADIVNKQVEDMLTKAGAAAPAK